MPDEEEKPAGRREKTRMCPSCRMAISVFATKCRFCGESVGRPKEADPHFTQKDLGGYKPPQHRLSDSFIGALEAFRAEEFPEEEGGDEVDNQRRREAQAEAEFDFEGDVEDAEVRLSKWTGSRTAKPRQKPRRLSGSKWFLLGTVLVLVIALYFAGIFAVRRVTAYLEARRAEEQTTFDNNALDTLARGGSVLKALDVAVKALEHENSEPNRLIAQKVRDHLALEVRNLLEPHGAAAEDGTKWDLEWLKKADHLVEQAIAIDPSSELVQSLKAEVDEEIFAYERTTVAKPDPEQDKVFVTMIYPENPLESVKKTVSTGDTVRDRFIVRKIAEDHVKFEDTKRKDRLGTNRTFKIYLDGTVVIGD